VRDRDLRISEFTQTNEKTPQNQKFDPETYDFGCPPNQSQWQLKVKKDNVLKTQENPDGDDCTLGGE